MDGTVTLQYPMRTFDDFDQDYFFNRSMGKHPLPKEIAYMNHYRVQQHVLDDIVNAAQREKVGFIMHISNFYFIPLVTFPHAF